MPPTSVTFHPTAEGYTLLELLLVLTLMGLMAGLVAPRLVTVYERLELAYQRRDLVKALAGLAWQAHSWRRAFVLDQYPSQTPVAFSLPLPPGWSLEADPPVRFLANGVCLGGVVQVLHGDHRLMELTLEPPYCNPRS